MAAFYTDPDRNNVYTSDRLAMACVEVAKRYARPSSVWVDPCCGDRAFSKHFPKGAKKITYDIDPAVRAQHTMDYRESEPICGEDVVVCSNMPFGRGRSINLALELILHAMQSARVVVVIVGCNILRDVFLGKLGRTSHGIVEVYRCRRDDFVPTIKCNACVAVFVRGKPSIQPKKHCGKPVRILSPSKDTVRPNVGIVKWGTALFKTVSGRELQRRWDEAKQLGRAAGQSTIFFVKVNSVTEIKRQCAELSRKVRPIYARWATTTSNINQYELNFWLGVHPTGLMNTVPKILRDTPEMLPK